MVSGAHVVLFSADAPADRAFLQDVLGFPHVDAGQGWLIFGLPPAEVAVHPADENGRHERYLLCDDIGAFVAHARAHGVPVSPVEDQGWGRMVSLTLPGGGTLGVYAPRHRRPPAP